MYKRNVNWHEAAVCAMQIELRDYSHLLDFYPEYILGKNNYRIDLLIIHKLPDVPIPKNIARLFNTYNLFEIKGLGSSLTPDAYYKTNGYAGLLINSCGRRNQYSRQNISLSFLSSHYPRKLFQHLTEDCKLMLEKISPGIYYIDKEMYRTQVLVTCELPPEENLYLHCLRRKMDNLSLADRLARDFKAHPDEKVYTRYMNQLSRASMNSEGGSTMVCEGILNICGTSSKEIEEKTEKRTKAAADAFYLPQIEKLKERIAYLEEQLALYESE